MVADQGTIHCYTDWSKRAGRTGCYFVTLDHMGSIILREKEYLGEMTTVFQAEVRAIHLACEYLRDSEYKEIIFFVDSQAALMAVDKHLIKSGVVKDCVEALELLGGGKRITLRWIKAHVGHPGNEAADEVAKEGTQVVSGAEPFHRTPLAHSGNIILSQSNQVWSDRWKTNGIFRQTKLWFPQGPIGNANVIIDRSLAC